MSCSRIFSLKSMVLYASFRQACRSEAKRTNLLNRDFLRQPSGQNSVNRRLSHVKSNLLRYHTSYRYYDINTETGKPELRSVLTIMVNEISRSRDEIKNGWNIVKLDVEYDGWYGWYVEDEAVYLKEGVPVHEHDFTYTVNGSAVTVSCECGETVSMTLTLPENGVYDGQPKAASVTTDKDGMGEITVKYGKWNGSGWDAAVTEAPTEIGKYQVYISVGESENYPATTQDITSDGWVFEIKAIFTFDAKSLAPESVLAFRFKGYLHDDTVSDDAYMEFKVGTIRTVKVPIGDASVDENGRYVFTCYENAVFMGFSRSLTARSTRRGGFCPLFRPAETSRSCLHGGRSA